MGRDQFSKRERDASKAHGLDGLDSAESFFFMQPRTSIPYRQLRSYEFIGVACPSPRTPTTRALWQMLGLTIVVLVLVQALSCGLFFCVVLPVGRASYIDLRELFTEFRLFNQPQSGYEVLGKGADPAPMLIPRIVHQTYRTRQVPTNLRNVMQSWAQVNGPGWQLRFYDDDACIDFVRREFPEYLEAYMNLPKDVERSDFFRYMVVLRLGGVYADIDVELRQPLDSVLGPTDTLVVGWEAEVATDAEAFKRHFVRRRQVLQWFFAAAPGHPVLRAACDHISRSWRRTFSNNTNRDTLERTGPGMWTDAVLRNAVQHPPSLANDPWKVRILPRVAFGVHPAGIDGLTPDSKEIVVLHHFLGSWKKRGGWHKRRSVLQILAGIVTSALQRRREAAVAEEPITPSVLPLFPVSAAFNPPFTVMTHLIGQGDMQSGSDVSALVTSWGTWQAAMSRPSRRPLAVEALVGSLGPPDQGAVLVDVSAGLGFFSLAAAARGHLVVAFETSARSIAALSAAVVYNGFQDRIHLYNVSLGALPSTLCLKRREPTQDGGLGAAPARALAQTAATAPSGMEWLAEIEASTEPNDAAAAATRRGYGDVQLHSLPPSQCASLTVRQTLAHMLMGGAEAAGGGTTAGSSTSGSAVPSAAANSAVESRAAASSSASNGVDNAHRNASASSGWDEASLPYRVGALRLSAHGWEGWILDGAEPWLARHQPGVVLLEYAPALIEKSGYPGGGMRLLQRLYDLGYVHVAHAGYVCDERWFNISRALRAGGTALGDLNGVTASAGGPSCGEAGAACAGSANDGAGLAGGGSRSLRGSGSLGGGSNVNNGAAAVGTSSSGADSGLGALPRQPTWCKLKPDLFKVVTDRAHPEVAENVLFIHRTHNSVRGEAVPPTHAASDSAAESGRMSSGDPVGQGTAAAAARAGEGRQGAQDAVTSADSRARPHAQAAANQVSGGSGMASMPQVVSTYSSERLSSSSVVGPRLRGESLHRERSLAQDSGSGSSSRAQVRTANGGTRASDALSRRALVAVAS